MSIDNKVKNVKCLHQFIRPKYYIPREGVGDCRTCTADKINNVLLLKLIRELL